MVSDARRSGHRVAHVLSRQLQGGGDGLGRFRPRVGSHPVVGPCGRRSRTLAPDLGAGGRPTSSGSCAPGSRSRTTNTTSRAASTGSLRESRLVGRRCFVGPRPSAEQARCGASKARNRSASAPAHLHPRRRAKRIQTATRPGFPHTARGRGRGQAARALCLDAAPFAQDCSADARSLDQLGPGRSIKGNDVDSIRVLQLPSLEQLRARLLRLRLGRGPLAYRDAGDTRTASPKSGPILGREVGSGPGAQLGWRFCRAG